MTKMNLAKKRLAMLVELAHGVTDSEDLPPNISRWTLRPHKVLHMINKYYVKTCFGLCAEFAGMNVDYMKSYEQVGKRLEPVFRENSVEDSQIAGRLMFNTSKSGLDFLDVSDVLDSHSCAFCGTAWLSNFSLLQCFVGDVPEVRPPMRHVMAWTESSTSTLVCLRAYGQRAPIGCHFHATATHIICTYT